LDLIARQAGQGCGQEQRASQSATWIRSFHFYGIQDTTPGWEQKGFLS
jgi:hypothetical protein